MGKKNYISSTLGVFEECWSKSGPGTHQGEAATETADTETRSSVRGWVSEGYLRQHQVLDWHYLTDLRQGRDRMVTVGDKDDNVLQIANLWHILNPFLGAAVILAGVFGEQEVSHSKLSLPPRSPRVLIPFSLLSLAWCNARYDRILANPQYTLSKAPILLWTSSSSAWILQNGIRTVHSAILALAWFFQCLSDGL